MKIAKNTALKILGAVAIAGLLTAGSSGCTEEVSATEQDERTTEQAMSDLAKAQPVPTFKFSQYRENLIEITTAKAKPTPTTSFFMLPGVPDPIFVCPSVGFAIPDTTQLTNPEQIAHRSSTYGYVTLPQAEPVGTFTGVGTATHVICRDANGRGFDNSWEGFVNTITGPAEWDYDKHQIVLIGAPSAEFTTGE